MLSIKYRDFYKFTGSGSTFHVQLDPCTRRPKTFHEEMLWNAEYINANRSGDIKVFFSGGIDSEYIMEIFFHLGIPVTPVIVRLNSDYNAHDIKYAFDYCEARGYKPHIIDFDFDKFVTSGEYLAVAQSVNCLVWQYPAIMAATLQVDGTVLLGSEEPWLVRNKQSNQWFLREPERLIALWHRWFKKNSIHGTPGLLSYTPESYMAFINDPVIVELVSNRLPGKDGSNSSKNEIYNRVFGSISPRTKYTGFENIRKSHIFTHPDLQRVISDPLANNLPHNGVFYLEVNKLRHLLQDQVN